MLSGEFGDEGQWLIKIIGNLIEKQVSTVAEIK